MFSHIQIGARDLRAMLAFYDAVLKPLGLVRLPEENDGGPAGAGWHCPGQPWPQFYVQLPFNGMPATWGNGVQVSFRASTQAQVEAAWQTAMDLGASDEGAPAARPQYCPGYFGAYCRDPEGNKLCFVFTPDFAQPQAC